MRPGPAAIRPARLRATLATAATVGACSAIFVASERDALRLGFITWFRHEDRGVAAEGTLLLTLFAASLAFTVGAFAAGGQSPRHTTAANVTVKATLLAAVAFMFAFPDLPQFEHKSLTARAILYPALAAAMPLSYAARRMRCPYPVFVDLCWSLALTVDIVGNDLHWYGNWKHWDDAVHLLNTLPIMFVIVAATLVLDRRGIVRIGFWGAAIFGLTLYTSLHGFWEVSEHLTDRIAGTRLQPGGMEEATRNTLSSVVGSLIAVLLLFWWSRSGFLERSFVAPLDGYVLRLLRRR